MLCAYNNNENFLSRRMQMGRKRNRNFTQRICAMTYRKKGLGCFLSCLVKSMKEVYSILNLDADCRTK